METQPTSPALSGKTFSGTRTLAAILVTDTVGFSALAAKNEEHTLKLVERDLERMKRLCDSFGGQTVKCTGDGLLLFFNSAVQAVSCALAIQKNISDQGRYLRPQDRLLHRVGVHLGDVFVNGEDVLGDGVNVAARLQGAARPGGVCLSSTIFTVVNNRVDFQVIQVETQSLKNVGKVVTYHILPPGVQPEPTITKPAEPALSWPNKVLVGGIAIALLSLGLVGYSVGKSYAASLAKRPAALTVPATYDIPAPTPAPVVDTPPVVPATPTTNSVASETNPTVTDQTYTPTDSTVPAYSGTPSPVSQPTTTYTPPETSPTSYPSSGNPTYTQPSPSPQFQQWRQMIRNREEERKRRQN